jgi:hypothetical protein
MTTATDGVRLTREQAASLQYTVHMHLLDATCLGDSVQLQRWLEEPDVGALARLGRRVTCCANVLRGIEHGELSIDDEVLALLSDCEREAQQSANEDEDGHPTDAWLSAGRQAMVRSVRERAREEATA